MLQVKEDPSRDWFSLLRKPSGISEGFRSGKNVVFVNGTKLCWSPMDGRGDSDDWRGTTGGSIAGLTRPKYTLELSAEVSVPNPGYASVIRDSLWVTSFFMLPGKKGGITKVGLSDGAVTKCKWGLGWPNEVIEVPEIVDSSNNSYNSNNSNNIIRSGGSHSPHQGAILVCDGFFVPGKNQGGIYMVVSPTFPTERIIQVTVPKDGWYYHHAVWVDMTGDGNQNDILAARAKGIGEGGELVWFENQVANGWKENVLIEGPDVTFAVVQLGDDDTFEVIAPEFFSKKVMLYSISRRGVDGTSPPSIVFSRTIDDNCGFAYGIALMPASKSSQNLYRNKIINGGGLQKSSIDDDTSFTHVIVTNHENSNYGDGDNGEVFGSCEIGGAMFSYAVPSDWRAGSWARETVSSSPFEVCSRLSFQPGAPGFPYIFKPDLDKDENYIALAGDGSERAYIFRPKEEEWTTGGGKSCLNYELMAEIEFGCTVGSMGISHGKIFGSKGQGRMANLFVCCHENDYVFTFSFARK